MNTYRKHIARKLGLKISSHEDIDFVDIALYKDTELFIDPCLIDAKSDIWSIRFKEIIDDYFNEFYSMYRLKKSRDHKLKMFEHAHEINATKLGYGNGRNGKAKTAEGMLETFSDINRLLNINIELSHPIDLTVFIEDFAEDCLSDMITNILFKALNDFTLEQCKKYGFKTEKPEKQYYYWDINTSTWAEYKGECLIVDNEVILLVPKHLVRHKFYYNTNQYFSMIILEKIREDNQWISNGKVKKPTKKSLRKKIITKDKNSLIAAIEYTKATPKLLNSYHDQIPYFYDTRGMDDESLDYYVYKYRR